MTYTLNFIPLDLEGEVEVLVGRQPFTAERLRDLRSEFYKTHVFQRLNSEDVIIDIPYRARRPKEDARRVARPRQRRAPSCL